MTWLGYVELQFDGTPNTASVITALNTYAAETSQSHEVLQLGIYGNNVIAEALWLDSFDAEAVKATCGAESVTALGSNRERGWRIALRLTTRSQRYTHEPNWYVDPTFNTADLSTVAQTWLASLLAAYDTPHVDFNWWSDVRFDGDLYIAARSIWFTAAGALGGFLVTGSLELLEVFDSLVARVLSKLDDYDADGFDELLYENASVAVELIGTDNGMDFNLLSSWLTVAAYVLHLNRDYNASFGAHAGAIEAWMFDHYLAEMVAEGVNAPAAPDDVYHCWTRGGLWLLYMERLWGYRNYSTRLTAIYNLIHPSLENTPIERENGSLVWDMRPDGRGWWGLQPSVYVGDTLISLVLLALEGIVPYDWLSKLAKTVTLSIFGGQAVFPGERDCGGHVVLEGEPFPAGNSDTYPMINANRFRLTGFAALAAWDESGIISTLADMAQASTPNEIAMCGWMLFYTAQNN